MKIYCDNNATTPLLPEVKQSIIEMLDDFGNPGSLHETGRTTKNKIAEAMSNIAHFFGAPESDLIITSCASEANNLILKNILFQGYKHKPHIITSNIEHPSVFNTAKFLEKQGVDVTYLPVNENGVISMKDLKNAIRKETVLISVMWMNNEIGTIQPLEEIGAIAKENGVFFHTDAVQAPGKIEFRLEDLPVDSASFSAHKMYAPKGIGLLYVRNLRKQGIIPLIHGGHQAQGVRAGTENTIGIVAFGAAAKALHGKVKDQIEYLRELRNYFEKAVKARIPDVFVNGEAAPRKPCTSNISFKFVEGESILLRLDYLGIDVSTGSACSTGNLDPSHVIMALHHDPEAAHGSVRFSFNHNNTKEQIDYLLEQLEQQILLLREISCLA